MARVIAAPTECGREHSVESGRCLINFAKRGRTHQQHPQTLPVRPGAPLIAFVVSYGSLVTHYVSCFSFHVSSSLFPLSSSFSPIVFPAPFSAAFPFASAIICRHRSTLSLIFFSTP